MQGGMRSGCPTSVHDGITRIGEYTGLVLYRQSPYQVELWILPPNMQSTEHSHPNVDIFLVHVTGDLKVWVGEELVLGPVQTVPDKNGVTRSNGNFIRIKPGQLHRAETGPLGGAFMNIQLWVDGKPRSTDSDWKGDALNEDHKKKLADLNRERLGEYVKSLHENSECSMREPRNISRRERTLADMAGHSEVDFASGPLIPGGVPPLNAAEEKSGEASAQNKSPAH